MLKLSVVGPAALSPLRRVLSNRLDRLVALRVFANASMMRQGGRGPADLLDRWGKETHDGKMALLGMLRECHALEELDLTAIGLTEFEARALAAALYGCEMPVRDEPTSPAEQSGARQHHDYENAEQDEDSAEGPPERADVSLGAWMEKFGANGEREGLGRTQLQLSLSELRLEHNELSFKAVQALMVPVADMRTLTRLELGGNRLGHTGGSALCYALAEGPRASLHVLGLGECDLGPEGMAALAPALRRFSKLQDLDLNSNRLTARGGTSLARALRSCTSLVSLTVNFNFLGKEGTCALAPLLGAQTSLTNLDLSFNDMGPAGVAALVEGMKHREQIVLARLNLSKNTLGARGASELFPLLRRAASTLQFMGLKFNGLGQQHSAMIKCQVPRARVEVLDI